MTKVQKEMCHSCTCLLAWLSVSAMQLYYAFTLVYKANQIIICCTLYVILMVVLIPATSYYTWQLDKQEEVK